MKAIIKIIVAVVFSFTITDTKAQQGYDAPTAEDIIQMQEQGNRDFSISPVSIASAMNGFTVQWRTINEDGISSFELEASEDKKTFTSVKKMAAGNKERPANIYQVGLNGSALQKETIYLRVKINFSNGMLRYTETAAVKFRKAK